MKKFISILLSMIFMLVLSACSEVKNESISSAAKESNSANSLIFSSTSSKATPKDNTSSFNTTSKSDTEENVTSRPRSSSNAQTTSKNYNSNANTTNYNDLKCREIAYDLWETVQIKNTKSKIILQLDLPSDWTISKANSTTLNIFRAGKKIGMITSGKLPTYTEDFDTVCNTIGNTEASMQIARYSENKKDVYYRNFVFTTSLDGSIFSTKLQIKYTELDDDAANDIMRNFEVILSGNHILELSKTNGSKQILILGNSFIRTSEIGSFLNDMLETSNSEYSATAISRGMAQVGNYAVDTALCASISQGNYCYLFMCGFYSSESIQDLYTIKEACTASNTQLIIFPAHNENSEVVSSAIEEHSDAAVLNWKNEIDALIESGVSYNDFCINDTHQHSKPLAGYVGAHMIYRSIFKTTPPALSNNTSLTNEYVNSKLKSYIANGGMITNNSIKIYEIN